MDRILGWLLPALLLAGFGYSIWWCFRAWPRIWAPPRTAFDTIVYRHGARGWGLFMWVASGFAFPIYQWIREQRTGTQLLIHILVGGVTMLPTYLLVGYWWGRSMAALTGVKDSSRAA